MTLNESPDSLDGIAEALRREVEIEADLSVAIGIEEFKAGILGWHQEELRRCQEAVKNGGSEFIR